MNGSNEIAGVRPSLLAGLAEPGETFPNQLETPHPHCRPVSPTRWLLSLLVLFCFVPRAWLAWKLPGMEYDGPVYVQAAKDLERGHRVELNTYPFILLGLHRAGLSWEAAGQCWGVAMGSLLVLPLFGWVRRQYNDRVALGACLLYAIHPGLIRFCPELLRDQTFWFLLILTLYLSWRAVLEVRLVWFLAAGVTITLALHTRFEGWFLWLVPAGWAVHRSPAINRRRLLPGMVTAAAMYPLLLLVVNAAWLRGQADWGAGSFRRLGYLPQLCQNMTHPKKPGGKELLPGQTNSTATELRPISPATAPARSAPTEPVLMPSVPRMSLAHGCWIFLAALVGPQEAGVGLLTLVGIWSWGRLWLRRDNRPLIAVAAAILGATGLHLWYSQQVECRYFLPLILLGLPFASLGWSRGCQVLADCCQRLVGVRPSRRGVAIASLVLLGTIGWGQSLTRSFNFRSQQITLGKWVLDTWGPGRSMIVSSPRLVLYYARAHGTGLGVNKGEAAAWKLQVRQPDLVVLRRFLVTSQVLEHLLSRAEGLGYQPLDGSLLPHGMDWRDVIVFCHHRLGPFPGHKTASKGEKPGGRRFETCDKQTVP